MKIAELSKDFRLVVAKKLTSPDEVFTSRELFQGCSESGTTEYDWNKLRVYLANNIPKMRVGRVVYYGNAKAIAKAKKITKTA